jgi:tRNA(Ile)-lysidine synthase
MVGGEKKPHALGTVEGLYGKLAQRLPLKPATLHGCVIQSDGMTVSIKPEGARRAHVLLTAD